MFSKLEIGQKLDADVFTKGDAVSVSGTSKGVDFRAWLNVMDLLARPKLMEIKIN